MNLCDNMVPQLNPFNKHVYNAAYIYIIKHECTKA